MPTDYDLTGNQTMTSSAIAETRQNTTVGMGQIEAAQDPDCLKSVLGSCVGVAIYHVGRRTGVLSHVVLPESAGRSGSPGKFADTAVPHMLALLKKMGVTSTGLVAKIAGGASMFAASGPMQVGKANVEAVARALSDAGIRIAAEHVGGTAGRRLTFDCSNGRLRIETIGNPPCVL